MTCKILYLIVNIFLVFHHSLQDSCNKPLGLGDGRIHDDSFSASSQHNDWHAAKYARLGEKRGATVWLAARNVVGEYVQVDLGERYVITAIATQGRNNTDYSQYLETYYVAYGLDGKTFYNVTDDHGHPVIFPGKNEATINYMPAIDARYIRVYAATWKRNVCTQLEIYGCKAKNCSINNGGCAEKCTQINDMLVECGCHKAGYELVDGVCQDIDECLNSPCTQKCKNTDGSFECSCGDGFTLDKDGKTCNDINECDGNHTCHHDCINTQGSYHCKCHRGFEFAADGKKCIDIDECKRKTSGCQHICENNIGGYQCSCNSGYKLRRDKKTCKDIDECDLNIDECAGICLNNEGSYSCQCRAGFVLDEDSHGCNDIDECQENTDGCSDACVNTIGSFKCTCPQGYVLKFDGKTCKDIDECQRNNGNCKHVCTNKPGSYQCSCFEGYKLLGDSHSCDDINECVEMTSKCDLKSTVCTNTKPKYRCDCKQGFEPISGNSVSCQRVKCGAFSVTPKFTVSPPRCLLSDTNVFGDLCTFKCALGYEPLLPGDNMEATCQANRQWSKLLPQCTGVKCPAIQKPSNGELTPPECEYGVRYPGICNIRCDSGYSNVGPSSMSCQKTGTFPSTNVGCQKDTITPVISCPPGIVAELPKGAKTMLVASQWKDAYANVGKITSSHDINFEFPVGITTVTFTTTTDDGQTDSCDIRVTILDKEPPKALYCPKSRAVRKTTGMLISWPTPQFTDNVGVVSVVPSRQPGTELDVNDHLIVYIAKDQAGNRAICKFYVNVTQKICSADDFKVDTTTIDKQCDAILGSVYCTVQCKTGRVFVSPPDFYYVCATDGIWQPTPDSVPDCVESSDFVNPCPQGTIQLEATDPNDPFGSPVKVCGNCPAGTFYAKGACEKCPVGTYQDKEKQMSCKNCSVEQGTQKTGAKKCERLCMPGTYSASGFPSHDEPCKLCNVGKYQSSFGAKSCMKCSGNTTTLSVGESSKSSCGREGTIKVGPSRVITVTEGENVQFVCHSSALPWFTMSWRKVNPIPGAAGGTVTQKELFQDGKLSGRSYSISTVTYHDRGVYMCETTNPFGSVQKCVTLNVLKNISQ